MTNVLITGANRGLGLGFVKSFLAKNVSVICATRNIRNKGIQYLMIRTRCSYLKNYNYWAGFFRYYFLLSPLKMCDILRLNLSNMVYELQKGS